MAQPLTAATPDDLRGGAECRRSLLARIDGALERLGRRRTPTDQDVHEARKEIKRARALLALLQPALDDRTFRTVRLRLRRAARPLAQARDAKVLDEAFGRVVGRLGRSRRSFVEVSRTLRRELIEARNAAGGLTTQAASARRELLLARRAVERTTLRSAGWRPVREGLRSLYRKGRQLRPAIDEHPSTPALHQWRRRVKTLQYAMDAFAGHSPARATHVRRVAARVGEWLGADHDLALLAARLEAFPVTPRTAILLRFIERERARTQARAIRAGRKLYADRPVAFEQRLRPG